jgi:uncharacterized protein YdeI (YjbR/CyaY-like superfamily)
VPPGAARPKVRFFRDQRALRQWFLEHHAVEREVWIGYYKRGVAGAGVTYAEAVEEALCFGWIDGQVRSLDERRYANRYTPRRPGSRWSAVNLRKIQELSAAGRVRPAGAEALARGRAANYLFEQPPRRLSRELAGLFRSNARAWAGFRAQPDGYRQTTAKWIMSAARPATRQRRLRTVMLASERGERIDLLSPGRAPTEPTEGLDRVRTRFATQRGAAD